MDETQVQTLVSALDAIRRGRTANSMQDRLSDTQMAKIANNALKAVGVTAKLSPLAESTLA